MRATALASRVLPAGGFHTETRTTFSVEEVVRGTAGRSIDVALPGGNLPSGAGSYAWMPEFRAGSDYVLFLARRSDGVYGVVELELGIFEVQYDAAGAAFAVRPRFPSSAAPSRSLDSAGGLPAERPAGAARVPLDDRWTDFPRFGKAARRTPAVRPGVGDGRTDPADVEQPRQRSRALAHERADLRRLRRRRHDRRRHGSAGQPHRRRRRFAPAPERRFPLERRLLEQHQHLVLGRVEIGHDSHRQRLGVLRRNGNSVRSRRRRPHDRLVELRESDLQETRAIERCSGPTSTFAVGIA